MRSRPMVSALVFALAALSFGVPAARGAAGLYLTWNDCTLAAAASHDLSWACDANAGEHRLTCAFGVDAPVDSVLGFEIVVDIQHSATELPDWWQLAAGGCRYGLLGADLDFRAGTECADFSLGRAAGGVVGYYVSEPRGGDNQARIKVAGGWLPDVGYASLDAAHVYYAACIVLSNTLTSGAGACAGCAQPACLVFNCMWLRRQPGAVGGDVLLSALAPDNGNWATWQGGAGANCAAVPARAVTWGRLKGLYR
jgi:hypothetical protein